MGKNRVFFPQQALDSWLEQGRIGLVDDEMTPSAHLPHDVFRESWMHIEIDRETAPVDIEAIEQALSKVLLDVREAVEDWERMGAQAREIVADLESNPPPLPPQGAAADGQRRG